MYLRGLDYEDEPDYKFVHEQIIALDEMIRSQEPLEEHKTDSGAAGHKCNPESDE